MFTPAGTEQFAHAVLAILAVILVAVAVTMIRRSRFSPVRTPFYIYAYLTARLLWRTEIIGQFPDLGASGAIIISNHRCSFDPVAIQMFAPRMVRWMVAREYCEIPALAWFFRLARCIPVSRAGADTGATREAIRAAQNGDLIGLFPEGRLNKTDQLLLPGRPGAAMIALRARAPVVPCYISGMPRAASIGANLLRPARVRMVMGKPIDLTPYYPAENGENNHRENVEEVAVLLLRAIAELAGAEDFEPKLAGRHWKPSA